MYFFLGPGRDLLYVGKADDPRRRLGRVGLERDAVAARDFFALGPHAVRRVRLCHTLAGGSVPADVTAERLEAELAPTLGPFSSGDAASDRADLARRAARHRQLRNRLRG